MNVWGDIARSDPPATALTDLYTVPLATYLVGIVRVANRGAATTFRVSVAPGGVADSNEQYSAYDEPIGANERDEMMIAAGPTDTVRVYAGANTLTFTLFGVLKT